MVVGVDGSEEARAALVWAVREARVRHAVVEAVCAWSLSLLWALGIRLSAVHDPFVAFQEAKEIIGREVALAQSELDERVPVEQSAIEGSPAEVLVEASRHASLLVVGARGAGGLRQIGLGSVSHHCAEHALCPVVVFRRQPVVPVAEALGPTG
ncbi:MAG: universal stress protein [Acidimicrobiia bacterium]|nr:universal stress protein [Acidimicrobiia bacterium]